jgi:cytochrome c oxidase cbb3-type subunit 1
MAQSSALPAEQYNYDIVRKFMIVAMVYGGDRHGVGVYIASELAWPFLNFDIPALTFGRLRPVHTSLVIFGFGGSALFATSYYIVQRTCQARLAFPWLAEFTFWGWTGGVALGVITYMGLFPRSEYAEFEWPLDIAITWFGCPTSLVYVETPPSQPAAHLCRQLVFSGLPAGRRPVAHLQQPGGAGQPDQIL